MSIVPEERKTIVYQNKVLLLLWGNKSFCIYYISRYRETPNYSAFNCKLNIPQVTSFKELKCKAVNKVYSVFQIQLNFDISVIAFQKLCTILGSLV